MSKSADENASISMSSDNDDEVQTSKSEDDVPISTSDDGVLTWTSMEEEYHKYKEKMEREFVEWNKSTRYSSYDLLVYESLKFHSLTVDWSSEPWPKVVYGNSAGWGYAILSLADIDFCTHKVKRTQNIVLGGHRQVGKARFMPKNHNIVGAKRFGGAEEVLVFDCAVLEDEEYHDDYDPHDPELRLIGEGDVGRGLAWDPLREGFILSASFDDNISLWDLSALPHQQKTLPPIHVYKAGQGKVIEDVQWHCKHRDIFGFVGPDCGLVILDSRSKKTRLSFLVDQELRSLSFNPYNEWIVATGCGEGTVDIYDMRMKLRKFFTLSNHERDVIQVEWDPNHENILASASDDGKVILWDLNRIGSVESYKYLEGDDKNVHPELLFSHGGHRHWIRDISWYKNEPWVISSVAMDTTLQVWKIAESVLDRDHNDIDETTSDGSSSCSN
ncbi:Guanine nucleotide-binding protein, beta subunit [Trema orientale]|uniref:Guanine nucleotide-binding protein, beta subunit n=1 Tax=Trema orientale TaxID=63057 RepID=A0A2P5EWR5_TREOI|nr:Guanine nucleotide-binding protein, beta subunit [Trema orientale]